MTYPDGLVDCLALAAAANSERFADWSGLRVTLHPATTNGTPPPVEPPAEPAAEPLPTAEWDDIQPAKLRAAQPPTPSALHPRPAGSPIRPDPSTQQRPGA